MSLLVLKQVDMNKSNGKMYTHVYGAVLISGFRGRQLAGDFGHKPKSRLPLDKQLATAPWNIIPTNHVEAQHLLIQKLTLNYNTNPNSKPYSKP